MTEKKDVRSSKIATLFDIRLILGVLLSLYGVLLLIAGLVDRHPSKSPGMHLNLWTGLAMLAVGVLMLVWLRLRPLQPPDPEDSLDSGPQQSRA